MKRLFWLILSLALLTVFVAQSYYNYECNLFGTQAADLTVQGVVCLYDLNGIRKYVTLDELHEREAKKKLFEDCIKRNPKEEIKCDPNFIPAGPGFLNG